MKHTYSIDKFSKDEIAQFRLKVITFFNRYGARATKEAFSVGRSTVFAWKKKLKEGNGQLMSLCPLSTAPKVRRRMLVDHRVYEFIKNLRVNNYRLGKDKLKKLLDVYCFAEGLETISTSKIGRIIKINHLFFPKQGRVYHDPAKKPTIPGGKRNKQRLASGMKIVQVGQLLQLDTVVKFDLGIRRYILTAIDLYSRFSFAFAYKSLSSTIALDFFKKLEVVAPFKIPAVKTDNGLEFLGNLTFT